MGFSYIKFVPHFIYLRHYLPMGFSYIQSSALATIVISVVIELGEILISLPLKVYTINAVNLCSGLEYIVRHNDKCFNVLLVVGQQLYLINI